MMSCLEETMKFSAPELHQRVVRMVSMDVGFPRELRLVFALMDAYEYFGLVENQQSPKCHEVVEILLSQELRPALRSWYRFHGGSINPAAAKFRDRLSALAGEKFG